MGNQLAKQNCDYDFRKEEWVEIRDSDQRQMFAKVNPYSHGLIVNKNTKQQVQVYQLHFLNQQDLDTCLNHYQLRYNFLSVSQSQQSTVSPLSSPYIYPLRHFVNLTNTDICSTTHTGLLYADKVALRLREINDIPFEDQVYLYKACLQGFKLLQEKYGTFQIREDMVFISKEGKVRVWINPNLAKIQPNYQPEYDQNCPHVTQSQTEMVHKLINIIERNTDYRLVNISFKQYLKQKNIFDRLSFAKAVNYFQAFVDEYRIEVGNFMYSIYGLFHGEEKEGQKWEQSQVEVVNCKERQDNYQKGQMRMRRSQFKGQVKSTMQFGSAESIKNTAKFLNKVYHSDIPNPQKSCSVSIKAISESPKSETQVGNSSHNLKDSINSTTHQESSSTKGFIMNRAVQTDFPQPSERQRTVQTLIQKLSLIEQHELFPQLPTSSTLPSLEAHYSFPQKKKQKKKKSIPQDYVLDSQLAADMLKYLSIDPRQL